MKTLVLFFVCMILVGCGDNKKELEVLQRKHEQAQAELKAELWELQNSHKRAFADAVSKSSIDQRHEALKQFIKGYPSSPLVTDASKEIQNLEKLIEKRRQRDQGIAKQNRSQEIASQSERQRRVTQEESTRQKHIDEKNRCSDLVRKGIANLQELTTALVGMNGSEVLSLIGRPDRVEQKREFYYYRAMGIEQATGMKRGIVVSFGGGTSFDPRVTLVKWRI